MTEMNPTSSCRWRIAAIAKDEVGSCLSGGFLAEVRSALEENLGAFMRLDRRAGSPSTAEPTNWPERVATRCPNSPD
jgi:hypothetical protein